MSMADDKSIGNDPLSKIGQDYQYGFVTAIEEEKVPKGLNEDIVRLISSKKNEPSWLLEWRLKAFRHWLTMKEPTWANVRYPKINYQDAYYYSAPKLKKKPKSLDEIDPELRKTYEKLGIPLKEQEILLGVEGADLAAGAPANVAVDAVFDSVSVATTYKAKLKEKGIIFCSFSDAVQEHPDLVRRWMGSVVPYTDNFFATLNSAVFTDGSFCYIPRGVKCPMELSTYFRINAKETGQFERTLIVAEEGASVSYLEGCTAPMRDENQLHAAVVELVALDNATIKYSTVQNWYPGDKNGKGGIYNFVTKRGHCKGANSRITWTQVETGSAITWKYPSCILQGDNSIGEFYSVAVANNYQQADTGTKMIHLGKNTRSTIISKGISAGHGQNTYRGAVKILQRAEGARNYSQCDSLLLGDQCGAHTFPYLDVQNPSAQVEHEASTSKIGEDQLFYCRQRGLSTEDAVNMIVNGFCKQVFKELPMEFAVEAQKLMSVSLEGSVG
jgi:Fe-S cluster assembly protein SufB